jgi:hypothetical protein
MTTPFYQFVHRPSILGKAGPRKSLDTHSSDGAGGISEVYGWNEAKLEKTLEIAETAADPKTSYKLEPLQTTVTSISWT